MGKKFEMPYINAKKYVNFILVAILLDVLWVISFVSMYDSSSEHPIVVPVLVGNIVVLVVINMLLVATSNIANKRYVNYMRWVKYIKENGNTCEGRVVEIVEGERRKGIDRIKTYKYIVSYFSVLEDREIEFETDELREAPDKDYRGKCTVYEVSEGRNDWYANYMGKQGDYSIVENYYTKSWFGERLAVNFE